MYILVSTLQSVRQRANNSTVDKTAAKTLVDWDAEPWAIRDTKSHDYSYVRSVWLIHRLHHMETQASQKLALCWPGECIVNVFELNLSWDSFCAYKNLKKLKRRCGRERACTNLPCPFLKIWRCSPILPPGATEPLLRRRLSWVDLIWSLSLGPEGGFGEVSRV